MSEQSTGTERILKQLGTFLVLLVLVLGVWADFSLWTIISRAVVVWAAYTILVSLLSVAYNYWQLEKRREAVQLAAAAESPAPPAAEQTAIEREPAEAKKE